MTIESIRDLKAVSAYLDRVGGEPKGLLSAVIKETVGTYWTELCNIKFKKDGSVKLSGKSTVAYEPTEDEANLIKAEILSADWPKCVYPERLENLPEVLKNANEGSLFKFYDLSGKRIIMLQHRIETDKGKAYIPWSYWNDDKWRPCEPETENDLLPLWGLHTIKGNTTAFISEGAKCGRFVERVINPKTEEDRKLREAFPWKEQFQYAASVSFVGGALIPERTDWSVLKQNGITRVIILSDRDEPGEAVIPKIADLVDLPCFAIKWSGDFSAGHDVADEFPKHYFKEINGKQYYHGPTFFDFLTPATQMTRLISVMDDKGKEKKIPVLRGYAKQQWLFVEGQDLFVNVEFPQFQFNPEMLDKYLRPFSDTKKVSELLLEEYTSRISKVAYRPDMPDVRRVFTDSEMAINLFRPTPIQPQEGDITPFKEFLRFLIPNEQEAVEVERWIATLVGNTKVRMAYGVLLISERTGVGKTLLCERILAPLVGHHNVSYPSAETVLEPYNGWAAKRRLAVISEVYQSGSWKLTQKLLSYITDTKIMYRELYCAPVVIDNWVTIIASSNSPEPMALNEQDRRWYAPTLTEERWPDEKYGAFLDWLGSGGLSIILHWARNYDNYIKASDKAPMTERKAEIIESSKPIAVTKAENLARLMNESNEPVAIGDKEILDYIKAVSKGTVYTKELEIRKTMKKAGAFEVTKKDIGGDGRISYSSTMQHFLVNKKAIDKLSEISDNNLKKDAIRSWMIRPSKLMVFED